MVDFQDEIITIEKIELHYTAFTRGIGLTHLLAEKACGTPYYLAGWGLWNGIIFRKIKKPE